MYSLDLYLFAFINGYAKKSRLLDFFGIFCARNLAYVLIAWLFIFSYFHGNGMHDFLIPMSAGIISVLAVNEIMYLFYKRKRPMDLVPNIVLIPKPISPAFPSSHASFFFALSFTLLLYNTPLAIIFTVFALCISLSRIFCGVHWPSDILGGILSALISFLVVVSILAFY